MNLIKTFLKIIKPKAKVTPKIIPFSPLDNIKEETSISEIELNSIDLDNIDPDDLLNNNLEVCLKQIPIDWFVFEIGQSPINRTWSCQLVEINSALTDESDDFSNVKQVVSIDKKTLCLAILECLTKIENEEYAIND